MDYDYQKSSSTTTLCIEWIDLVGALVFTLSIILASTTTSYYYYLLARSIFVVKIVMLQ